MNPEQHSDTVPDPSEKIDANLRIRCLDVNFIPLIQHPPLPPSLLSKVYELQTDIGLVWASSRHGGVLEPTCSRVPHSRRWDTSSCSRST